MPPRLVLGVQAVTSQGDIHLLNALVQQDLRGLLNVCLIADGHAAEQLCLHAVGLQRRQLIQHRQQLRRLDGADRIGQDRRGAVAAQPLDRRLRQVRLYHHQVGVVDEVQTLAQEVRRHVVVNGHVIDGQCHVTVAVVNEQVGAGAPIGDDGAVGQVQTDGSGVFPHALGEAVLPQYRDHGNVLAQQAQVMGDVAAHTAQRSGDAAGVGVPRHQRRV